MKKTTIKSYEKQIINELNSVKYNSEEFKIITSGNYGGDDTLLHFEIAYIDLNRLHAIVIIEVRTDSKTCSLWNYINLNTWLNTYVLNRINKVIESLSQKSFIGVAE